jgi:hypothetical protein
MLRVSFAFMCCLLPFHHSPALSRVQVQVFVASDISWSGDVRYYSAQVLQCYLVMHFNSVLYRTPVALSTSSTIPGTVQNLSEHHSTTVGIWLWLQYQVLEYITTVIPPDGFLKRYEHCSLALPSFSILEHIVARMVDIIPWNQIQCRITCGRIYDI